MEGTDKDMTAEPAEGQDVTNGTQRELPDGVTMGTLDDLAAVEEIATLRSELDTLRDRVMRQAAEFQNYRRRVEQEKTLSVSLGKSLVIQQILDVVDDFRRSLEAADQVAVSSESEQAPDAFVALRQGVHLVFEKLQTELERLGVEEIEAVGRPFDEAEHEALMQQPVADGQEPGMVVGELQKGYRLGDRVLRHSKVIVSA